MIKLGFLQILYMTGNIWFFISFILLMHLQSSMHILEFIADRLREPSPTEAGGFYSPRSTGNGNTGFPFDRNTGFDLTLTTVRLYLLPGLGLVEVRPCGVNASGRTRPGC